MNIALLLKSELRRSAGILAGMALIIALALSIAVAAGICERMVKASAAQSADDFDLLIGARGSSSALLLGTVFLRDEMLPIVPASAWANIREAQTAKSSIRWAAPVAFGDRTPLRPHDCRHNTLLFRPRQEPRTRCRTFFHKADRGRCRRLLRLCHRRQIFPYAWPSSWRWPRT